MDYNAYRKAFFTDPPPEPRFQFSGTFGTTLFFEEFDEAVAFYTNVLGPPPYIEAEGTCGWQVGDGWLTLLRGQHGNPRNVELTFELRTTTDAEALQQAFVAAGGRGEDTSPQLMYRPVLCCPVVDPFGLEILIVAPLENSFS